MNILQLNTGLYPDAQTVMAAMAALRQVAPAHRVEVVDITRRDMQANDWEAAIRAILAADRVVSI